ncbi:MAG: tRNA (adenosine(37)-N6)-threonylcarbamoyltransferase complex dimerization subunit type 1 TsaB [candidate division Zixibacteria bacterium]|nr:tRNA (adenosine(37)-N6)-threonylcarbamoyltransferase complex dimerization subunit type 1 TsaB [candidate division Zixibacteria bacterium]
MNNVSARILLGIDTSSRYLRLGLTFGGDRLVQSNEESERSHGQFIIKKIGELFQSASLQPAALEGIVVCVGPGSFTGLRIGLAAAKGMVTALDIPLVPVTVFEIAAFRLRHVKETVHVVIPLNRDECIVGPVKDGDCEQELARVVKYNQLFETVGNDAVAAMGFLLHERYPEVPVVDYTDQLDWQAADLLHLGREKLLKGEIADPAILEPLYLQKSQAEIRFEERQQKD